MPNTNAKTIKERHGEGGWLIAIVVALVLYTGCSRLQKPNTGFLTPAPDSIRKAQSFHLLEVRAVNRSGMQRPQSDRVAHELAELLRAHLVEEFSKTHTEVPVATLDSLGIRAALVEYSVTYNLLNLCTTLTFGLPLSYGGSSTEIEVLGPNGEVIFHSRSAENYNLLRSDLIGDFKKYGHARRGVRRHARLAYEQTMDRLKPVEQLAE
jgi:hypothetical protein